MLLFVKKWKKTKKKPTLTQNVRQLIQSLTTASKGDMKHWDF